MKEVTAYIESGILELYLSGNTNPEESEEVEMMVVNHPEVRAALYQIEETIEFYASSQAIRPNPTIKPFLMATMDYTQRLKQGESGSFPPQLHEGSKLLDYAGWLDREDMVLPADFTDFHAKIIGHAAGTITAIIWLKDIAPPEVHDHEHEKFLIVEGACDVTIAEKVYQLVPGDFLNIPLHVTHMIKVTSAVPCKAILQRTAA